MSKRIIHRIDEATRSKDLTGKVYIVTGANSGVGQETRREHRELCHSMCAEAHHPKKIVSTDTAASPGSSRMVFPMT